MSNDQNGRPCIYKYKEHQAAECKESRHKRSGLCLKQRTKDDMFTIWAVSSRSKQDGCSCRRTETRRAKKRAGPIISNERVVKSEAFGSYCPLAQQSMLEVMSSEDDDDFFPDEEGEPNVMNLFLEVVAQTSSGMRVASFLEDEELARRALSCHRSMDFLCQEVQAAWWSEDCQKVRHDVPKCSGLFPCLLREESVFQTPGLQVLHRVWTIQHWSCLINAMLPRRHSLTAFANKRNGQYWVRQYTTGKRRKTA